MKLRTGTALVAILLSSIFTASYADEPTADELSAEAQALCHELSQVDLPNPITSAWRAMMQDLGILTHPAPFSRPADPIVAQIPEPLRVRDLTSGPGRNVIFSIAPPAEDEAWFEQPQVKGRYE